MSRLSHHYLLIIRCLFKYVSIVLADCDQAYPRTLSETSQISSLATSCATYTGDIVISKVTATIDLTGVQTIIGSISYEYDDSFENEPITFLSSSLENVTEGLTLSGLAEAKKDRRGRLDVSLPALKITDSLEISGGWGEVSVETDPRLNVSGYFGLNGMTFSNDHGIYATSLYVNISLASTLYLTGLNFLPPDDSRLAFSPFKERKDSFISTSIQRLRRLSITHNPGLTHVLLDSLETATATIEIYSNSDLNHISSSVIEAHEVFFEQNGRDTHLSFPNIKQINGEATFQDLANASLPELNAAYHSNQGSFNFTGNSFPELHLPRLETINCTFVIVNNNILNNIALPRLNEVKNLEIHNNPRLLNVTVNALRKANSINITGPLTNVELFSLELVTGGFYLAGDETMDCSWFDDRFPNQIVKSSYRCIGNHTKPAIERTPSTPMSDTEESPSGSSNSNDNGGGKGGLSMGAKAGIGVSAGVVGFLVLGFGAWFLIRRREAGRIVQNADPGYCKAELDGNTGLSARGAVRVDQAAVSELHSTSRHELADTSRPAEMGN
ncbi:hypothetical protein FVEN_g6741 [Fusarium venenatum]|uniref:Receptor L-domain domain-containing protein n=1 Tax=Fusarium venenatum TaxID=56646 RepID=A0A2L2TRM1_9HYPO|nr:uncharacterized protein FVRRES_00122 [Fusarium venenatum]KAG8355512.1 hypothetical protein FVEN_g6741 [Fusarium venenatum]KAH7006623.1 hypothetical protein EDB82DRAFT_573330 [Fusarium venenatum]CEI63610.1 unnamed protein product [Fusarium venenatum]